MDQDPLLGRTIGGRFRIEAFLGEGAMGRVYRARQIALNTTVALKVIHHDLASLPAVEARFLREAQAASRIDHPSSVRVIDFGKEDDGLLYLAMELLRGQSLAEILVETGPMPAARIVEIASQVLAALAVAHELGVVHRDLKPENIMVLGGKDDDGRPCDIVKVCDFGIAKLVDDANAAPTVTQEGTILGTPAYMSPEQARGEPLDGRSDIYAMGVLLFQMMTGEVPFDASSPFGTALMHVTDEPTKPRLLVPTVDSRLEAICLKAMRKRPDERYASARELRTELRALLDHADAPASALSSIAPTTLRAQVEDGRGRSGRIVVGLALGGAALAGAFLFGVKSQPAPSAPPAIVQAAAATATAPATAAPVAPPTPATDIPAPEPEVATAPAATRPDGASRSGSRRAQAKAPAAKPKALATTEADAKAPADMKPVPISTRPASPPSATTPAPASPPAPAPAAAEPKAPPAADDLPVFIPRPNLADPPKADPPAAPPPPAPAPEPKPAEPPQLPPG